MWCFTLFRIYGHYFLVLNKISENQRVSQQFWWHGLWGYDDVAASSGNATDDGIYYDPGFARASLR